MAVHIDLEAQTLIAAVRDLATQSARQTRRRTSGLWQQLRARLGNEVHERYARWCETNSTAIRTEVAVDFQRTIDEFTVTVRGRMDGIDDSADPIVIEEVKSILDYSDQLRLTDVDMYPHFCKQLRLYGLAAAQRWPDRTIELRLVLGSIIDGGWHRMDVPFSSHVAETGLRATVRALIRQARRARERARDRALTAGSLAFPYETLRTSQDQLIATIGDGLANKRPIVAMAPTGTGKTVSALLPAMRAALGANASVYFATAKTTQQALVASTFDDIAGAVERAGPPPHRLLALTMRAKERMCPPGDLACHPDLCEYLESFDQRAGECVDALIRGGGHLSADRIFDAGQQHRLCPFELSLAVSTEADVVIGDYNYAFDRSAATPLPSFVVVDEAHNLFDRARGYDSPFLSRAEIAALPPNMRALSRQALAAMDSARPVLSRNTSDEDLVRVELDPPTWHSLATDAENALLKYVVYKRAKRIVTPRDPISGSLRTILQMSDLLSRNDPALIPYASRSTDGSTRPSAPGVGILCVDPSTHLAACHRSAMGTVAMSATLSPLRYYADVLGFSDLEPVLARAPSPFPAQNRCVMIVPTIETSYRHRHNQLGSIATAIADIVTAHPGNYAVYFPSFALLTAVAPHLRVDPAMLLTQERGMSRARRGEIIDELRSLRQPRLLLAVMGGIFAEGIDLPGDALIGAIIVGPGLPPIGFERATMRAYFQRSHGNGFAYAMLYPGMQRVVQSAGRVIRTMTDRGVIALLGSRFARNQYSEAMPAEWHQGNVANIVTDAPAARLAEFWDGLAERLRSAS